LRDFHLPLVANASVAGRNLLRGKSDFANRLNTIGAFKRPEQK